MSVLYNENDPAAAEWLRELIRAGAIAPGEVADCGIEDLDHDYVGRFDQFHAFAGIGVWSYALRLAGVADDFPVWTGSCPCQPFSAAGKGAGFADERHLWPAWFHLIGELRPAIILGEQVASKDGLAWLDLVHADLEAAGYACGAADLCAAGVGAPHIRQRLWWVAQRLADADDARPQGRRLGGNGAGQRPAGAGGVAGGLADARGARIRDRGPGAVAGASDGAEGAGPQRQRQRVDLGHDDGRRTYEPSAASPPDILWGSPDWLFCRDGCWRPVEPGTFPLAHGAAGRVGRLRGYGNALCAPAARTFIEAALG